MRVIDCHDDVRAGGWAALVRQQMEAVPDVASRLRAYLALFRGMLDEAEIQRRVQALLPAVSPRRREEIRQVAEMIGGSEADLLLANLLGDVFRATGCSSLVLVGARGPIVAHNFDWPDFGLAHGLSVLSRLRRPAPGMLIPGFAGISGIASGINGRGVGLFLHDSHTGAEYVADGAAPLALALRDCLEEVSSARQAVERMSRFRAVHGFMLVAVDRERAFILERAGTDSRLQEVGRGDMATRTNHFRLGGICNAYPESATRLEHLDRTASAIRAETATAEECWAAIAAPGVFRPLDRRSSGELVGASLHSVCWQPATGTVLVAAPDRVPTLCAPSPLSLSFGYEPCASR